MTILVDSQIKDLAVNCRMIEPFIGVPTRYVSSNGAERKVVSYGLSAMGYDVTLSPNRAVVISRDVPNGKQILDPLNFDESVVHDLVLHTDPETGHQYFIIPPHGFVLGYTVEYFRMPKDVMAACFGKSTYARSCIDVHVTPIEPGFEGNVVLEFSNESNVPVRLYANQGVCQFVFFKSEIDPDTTYADKGGKYQGQTGITFSKG